MCTAQVLPVMDIPGLGNMAAKTMCDDWKIKTQGDKKLEEAKKILYLKGFNEGVMVVGNYKGRKVTITTTAVTITSSAMLPQAASRSRGCRYDTLRQTFNFSFLSKVR